MKLHTLTSAQSAFTLETKRRKNNFTQKKFSQIAETTKRTVVKETNLYNKEREKERKSEKIVRLF